MADEAEEERGYLAQIEVSEAELSAAQNFLGDTVTFVDTRITNQGGQTVERIELQFEFLDTLNQVVLRKKGPSGESPHAAA